MEPRVQTKAGSLEGPPSAPGDSHPTLPGGIWAPLRPVGFSLKGRVWPSPEVEVEERRQAWATRRPRVSLVRLCPSAARPPLLRWREIPGGLKGTLPPKSPKQGRGGDSPTPASAKPCSRCSQLLSARLPHLCGMLCPVHLPRGQITSPQSRMPSGHRLGQRLLERWKPSFYR